MADKLLSDNLIRSGIITVDLSDYEPEVKSVFFDIKDGLEMGHYLK
ncbi:hypothetical protein V6R21_02670 [Limibacter armeniacum]